MIRKLTRTLGQNLRMASTRALSVLPTSASHTLAPIDRNRPKSSEAVVLQGIGASTKMLVATQRRQGFIAKLTAFLFVFIPTLAVGGYMLFFAADQYQVETRFATRSNETKSFETLGMMAGLPSVAATSDSYLLVDYIRSADLIRDIDREMKLREVFGKKGDWFYRVPDDITAEKLLLYWRDMIRVRVEASSQSVVVNVRTFDALDAMKIANLVLKKSELLVNNLSEKARSETLASAQTEVKLAETRLAKSREASRAYRDQSKILDPRGSIAARQELMGKLQAEIASLSSELRSLRRFLAENAPSIISLRTRISSMESELEKVKSSIDPNDSGSNLPAVIENFENLQTETVFAEKAYVVSMAALERARMEADRSAKYLAVHVRPTEPESAIYPRRVMITIATLVIAFLVWASGWLIYLGIRDHMH